MDFYDWKKTWSVLAIVVGLVLMAFGGWYVYLLDQQRKAQEAGEKVALLATACATAGADYQTNWESATATWNQTRREFSERRAGFRLGGLQAPDSVPGEITDICGPSLAGLRDWLENGTELVKVYDTAVALIDQLNQIVSSATAELQQARDAKGAIEGVEAYAWYTVEPHVYNPPFDAVDPRQAVITFEEGISHITQAWYRMAESEWDAAKAEAGWAQVRLTAAYNYASSPTPTPLPTPTSEPTNTPEPYVAPPTTDYDWSSSDSAGSDSGSWDSGGSDSGSWDSGGSDSGSWDSGGSDSGSWDSGGSDSGSWDSGGSDSGSWKIAPRVTPLPTRVVK